MDWELILKTLGVSGILVAGVILLGKALMGHLLSKDVESFKAELKISAFEHEIRFSKLHDKVDSTIAKLYKKLARTTIALGNYVTGYVPAGSPSETERAKAVVDVLNEFINYYEENKIYFNTNVCAKLEEFISKNKKVFYEFQYKNETNRTKEWIRIAGEFEKDVQNAKLIIEEDFRKILGVKNKGETIEQRESEQKIKKDGSD